jgi:uncharacterized protein YqjF (DUF2071 family)
LHVPRGRWLWSARVHHQPYPLQRAEVLSLAESFTRAARLPQLGAPPLAHFAAGVDVQIDPPRIRRLR